MSDYRRYNVAGATYFFTIVTHGRRSIFANEGNVQRLREAIAAVRKELPFEFNAAVVLPDHLHFLWTLPVNDYAYSKRIGRMKVHFTQDYHGIAQLPGNVSLSRRKRRESDVWQRRFWEHLIRDEHDFERHFDYIHYNPVKHGLATCPHGWEASRFHRWVERGVCDRYWGCNCDGRQFPAIDFVDIADTVGE